MIEHTVMRRSLPGKEAPARRFLDAPAAFSFLRTPRSDRRLITVQVVVGFQPGCSRHGAADPPLRIGSCARSSRQDRYSLAKICGMFRSFLMDGPPYSNALDCRCSNALE